MEDYKTFLKQHPDAKIINLTFAKGDCDDIVSEVWFTIIHGTKFYKVQKTSLSIDDFLDLITHKKKKHTEASLIKYKEEIEDFILDIFKVPFDDEHRGLIIGSLKKDTDRSILYITKRVDYFINMGMSKEKAFLLLKEEYKNINKTHV